MAGVRRTSEPRARERLALINATSAATPQRAQRQRSAYAGLREVDLSNTLTTRPGTCLQIRKSAPYMEL